MVRLFSSVPAACKEINKEPPDILIVDAMMGVEHMVCSLDASDQDRDRLLVLADEALYRAKRGGRNQVCQ